MTWTYHKTLAIQAQKLALNYISFDRFFRWHREETACSLCDTAYQDGDVLHLSFTDQGNLFICDSCKEEALKHGVPYHDMNG